MIADGLIQFQESEEILSAFKIQQETFLQSFTLHHQTLQQQIRDQFLKEEERHQRFESQLQSIIHQVMQLSTSNTKRSPFSSNNRLSPPPNMVQTFVVYPHQSDSDYIRHKVFDEMSKKEMVVKQDKADECKVFDERHHKEKLDEADEQVDTYKVLEEMSNMEITKKGQEKKIFSKQSESKLLNGIAMGDSINSDIVHDMSCLDTKPGLFMDLRRGTIREKYCNPQPLNDRINEKDEKINEVEPLHQSDFIYSSTTYHPRKVTLLIDKRKGVSDQEECQLYSFTGSNAMSLGLDNLADFKGRRKKDIVRDPCRVPLPLAGSFCISHTGKVDESLLGDAPDFKGSFSMLILDEDEALDLQWWQFSQGTDWVCLFLSANKDHVLLDLQGKDESPFYFLKEAFITSKAAYRGGLSVRVHIQQIRNHSPTYKLLLDEFVTHEKISCVSYIEFYEGVALLLIVRLLDQVENQLFIGDGPLPGLPKEIAAVTCAHLRVNSTPTQGNYGDTTPMAWENLYGLSIKDAACVRSSYLEQLEKHLTYELNCGTRAHNIVLGVMGFGMLSSRITLKLIGSGANKALQHTASVFLLPIIGPDARWDWLHDDILVKAFEVFTCINLQNKLVADITKIALDMEDLTRFIKSFVKKFEERSKCINQLANSRALSYDKATTTLIKEVSRNLHITLKAADPYAIQLVFDPGGSPLDEASANMMAQPESAESNQPWLWKFGETDVDMLAKRNKRIRVAKLLEKEKLVLNDEIENFEGGFKYGNRKMRSVSPRLTLSFQFPITRESAFLGHIYQCLLLLWIIEHITDCCGSLCTTCRGRVNQNIKMSKYFLPYLEYSVLCRGRKKYEYHLAPLGVSYLCYVGKLCACN